MHISQYMGKKWTFHMGRFVGFKNCPRSPTFPLTAWREWQRIWWSCHEDLWGLLRMFEAIFGTHNDLTLTLDLFIKRCFFNHSSRSKSPLNHHFSHEKYWKVLLFVQSFMSHVLDFVRSELDWFFEASSVPVVVFAAETKQSRLWISETFYYSGLWKRHKLRMNWDGNVLHVSEFLLSVI